MSAPSSTWSTRSVRPDGSDGGAIVYRYFDGTRESQLDAERAALKERALAKREDKP